MIVFFIAELLNRFRKLRCRFLDTLMKSNLLLNAVRLSATQKKREAHLQNFSAPPGCLELRLSTTSSQGHFVARCNDEVQRIVYFRVM